MTESLKILVVDDDLNMAKTLMKILQMRGYQAVVANTANRALMLAQKNNFNCVLSDIKMPGMSGVDLLHAFHQFHPDLPIILMTAYAPSDLLTASIEKGVVAVLNKPLDYDLLFMYLSAIR